MRLKLNKKDYFYPLLLLGIWLITYIVCQFVFPHMLGWDEIAYLSVARGIAEDFDFSARSYTVMGLLKYGYPSTLINFPVYPVYLALFFKLFGVSQKIAYFATWLAALGVCLLIYLILLKLIQSKKAAFSGALLYLFFPSVLKNCDTAMMEQAGCFLLCLMTFLLILELEKGKWNYLSVLKFSFILLILWLYKTLFVGALLGFFIFTFLAFNSKITGSKINAKLSFPIFAVSTYGLFAGLYVFAKKFIFYPVAPMFNFHISQESKQIYAEFLGGLFNNFPEHMISNISAFLKVILGSYFLYPCTNHVFEGELATYQESILALSAYYYLIGGYLFLLLIMVVLLFANWKELSSKLKVFSCYAFGSIVFFNLALMIVFKVYHENFWRYNTYYLPLFVCLLIIILFINLKYFKPFFNDHPRASKALLAIFFICLYIPLSISAIDQYIIYETKFHRRAKIHADLIRTFLGNQKPDFIYYNDGIHTTFLDYPIRQIFKDATNEQILKVNAILPKPIEYLFIKKYDWLYQVNKEKILNHKPIINNQYQEYGYTTDGSVAVYRYVGQ